MRRNPPPHPGRIEIRDGLPRVGTRGYSQAAPPGLRQAHFGKIPKGFRHSAQRCDAESLRWVKGAENCSTLNGLSRGAVMQPIQGRGGFVDAYPG